VSDGLLWESCSQCRDHYANVPHLRRMLASAARRTLRTEHQMAITYFTAYHQNGHRANA
jgi:predicted anti-sigma-YlaC factor YlaD